MELAAHHSGLAVLEATIEDSPRRPADPVSMAERRAAVCVRACEGIPTVALKRNVLVRLVAACIHLKDPEIREILDEM